MNGTDFVTLGDGCRLAWRMDGPERAPVLMLCNSLGTNMEMWAPQLPALSRQFRVLRYDSRGHGRSDAPAGAYGLDRLARDAIELLDALDIGRVHFCGLSLGGMIGQWLGVRAPDRVERLVLANTASFMGPPASWDARIRTVKDQGMPALTDAVLERWFTKRFRDAAPDRVAPVRDMLLATQPDGYAGCCAAIRDMDLRPVVGRIGAPALVVLGDEDPATPPSDGLALAAAINGAATVSLPAAHLSNIEAAEGFTAALMQFLTA